VFRRARREDLIPIVRLLADDVLGATRERPGEPRRYNAAFERIDGDPRNLLAVADVRGRVVGCLQLTFIPGLSNRGADLALVQAVRVEAVMRGQGVGQAFMTWAMEEARARGCASIELLSHNTRTDARRFYERLGFTASHVGMKRAL
jgi:GNAT superfamily N-acetyltransferase